MRGAVLLHRFLCKNLLKSFQAMKISLFKSVRTLLVCLVMAASAMPAAAQTQNNVQEKGEEQKEPVLKVAEKMPEYPGGMSACLQYLSDNIRYPADAAKQKIEGRVLVTFIINKDGSVSDAEVLRPFHPSLDLEALRVVLSMPNWEPGYQRGHTVRVRFTVPVTFRLSKKYNY